MSLSGFAGQPRRRIARRDHRDESRRHARAPMSRKTKRMSRAVLSASNWKSTTTHHTPFGLRCSHFTASFSVIRTAPGSSNASCSSPISRVILERMRFDVELRVAQQIEEPLRIADAGDGVHGLGAKRVERAQRAVLQVIDLRDDGLRAKHSGMTPIAAVDDDRVDFLQARHGLAQRPRRQAQPVAHAAHAVDDGDLERARRAGSAAGRRRTARRRRAHARAALRRSDAIRARDDGATRAAREQHGLVADLVADRYRGATARGHSVPLPR